MFEPQDLLIAFSDGVDDDGNGYVDDIVGWDFVDDDNDPFDDVQYGHGTGEAQDSTAEADNGGDVGACPNCMGIYLRVGDSFVADVNRFGAAVTYATDNDVQIVQEALGSLNNSSLARDAVNYAYRHGVTVMASAADEAAQHNNWPSSLPHVIVANSVRDGDGVGGQQVVSGVQRLHQLRGQDHDLDPQHLLFVERGRAGRGLCRPDLQRRIERRGRRGARSLSRSLELRAASAAIPARSPRTRSSRCSPRARSTASPRPTTSTSPARPRAPPTSPRARRRRCPAARAPTGPATRCAPRSTPTDR